MSRRHEELSRAQALIEKKFMLTRRGDVGHVGGLHHVLYPGMSKCGPPSFRVVSFGADGL